MNSRMLTFADLGVRVVSSSSVQATAGAGPRCINTSMITRRRPLLSAAGTAGTSSRVSVQCQLDTGRAIQQHAPQLITGARLTTRSPGTKLAARTIGRKQLMDQVDMLKRARDDELGQVGAGVVLHHKRNGGVVEEAARHRRVVDIVEGGATAGTRIRDDGPGTALDEGDEGAEGLHDGPPVVAGLGWGWS